MAIQHLVLFVSIVIIGVTCDHIQLPEQVWNHIGPDTYGLIAPAAALWGRTLILSGGSDGWNNHSEVWKYNLNTENDDWVLSPDSMEDMFNTRTGHTSNVYRDYLFHFGGNADADDRLEVQQLRNGNEHVIYKGPSPKKRLGHTATLRNEDLYLFGGYDFQTGEYTNDLWRANVRYESLEWELIEMDSPCPKRAGHTAVLYQESLYIFGGQNDNGFLNDVWRYDFLTHDWVRTYIWSEDNQLPEGRIGHSAVYWSDEKMYIWGGYGEIGFLADMWSFNFQTELWEKVFEGHLAGYQDSSFMFPSARAFFGYTIFEGRLLVLGGQVTLGGIHEMFWSPHTRFVPITHPDDFAGDVWAYTFKTNTWEFIGCLPPWADKQNITSPLECRSHFQPICKNNCSGNGVCVRDGHCICRGEWVNDDCSYNVCFEDPYLGYDINLMDRILISESILGLGKNLHRLREKLQYIKDRLPPFEEFTTCVKFNPVIEEIVREQAGIDGLSFNQDLNAGLLPISHEFNYVLEATAQGDVIPVLTNA